MNSEGFKSSEIAKEVGLSKTKIVSICSGRNLKHDYKSIADELF